MLRFNPIRRANGTPNGVKSSRRVNFEKNDEKRIIYFKEKLHKKSRDPEDFFEKSWVFGFPILFPVFLDRYPELDFSESLIPNTGLFYLSKAGFCYFFLGIIFW